MADGFYTSTNNGVTALIPHQWYSRIYELRQFWDDDETVDWFSAVREGARIFTFCSACRLMRNPREMRYFTGIYEDIPRLLKLRWRADSELTPKDFWVPFSKGLGKMKDEHYFTTSHSDLIAWFGHGAETAII